MIGSAQKAPVASAALTALSVAVVRQSVFERAAQQIADRTDHTTEDLKQAAESNRSRNRVVDAAISKTAEDQKSNTDTNKGKGSSDPEFQTPDFSTSSGAKVDIKV